MRCSIRAPGTGPAPTRRLQALSPCNAASAARMASCGFYSPRYQGYISPTMEKQVESEMETGGIQRLPLVSWDPDSSPYITHYSSLHVLFHSGSCTELRGTLGTRNWGDGQI